MVTNIKIPNPNEHDVTRERGFLPKQDPIPELPPQLADINCLAQNMPQMLAEGSLHSRLLTLPPADLTGLREGYVDCAMRSYSYFGSAFVYGGKKALNYIPSGVAVPLHLLSKYRRIGRKPILSYASYCLYNWRRIDPNGPIALGNIALIQNFLGDQDENWFILIHVDIEAKAGPALVAIPRAQQAVLQNDTDEILSCLDKIAKSEKEMLETLFRMRENCDPYNYYTRVRPYIHAFRGITYQGVEEYGEQPRDFFGETGAQSSISPALNAALGVEFTPDPLTVYEAGMLGYMPPRHRSFIRAIERADKNGASIRKFVLEHKETRPELVDAYNACVDWKVQFLEEHIRDARDYIERQAQTSQSNPTHTGTGGTPFMTYLTKHIDETRTHLIE